MPSTPRRQDAQARQEAVGVAESLKKIHKLDAIDLELLLWIFLSNILLCSFFWEKVLDNIYTYIYIYYR